MDPPLQPWPLLAHTESLRKMHPSRIHTYLCPCTRFHAVLGAVQDLACCRQISISQIHPPNTKRVVRIRAIMSQGMHLLCGAGAPIEGGAQSDRRHFNSSLEANRVNDVQRPAGSVPSWCTLADKLARSQTSEIGPLPAWNKVLLQSVCQAWGIAPALLMSQSPFITSSGCGGGGRTSHGGLLKCAEKRINVIAGIKNPLRGALGSRGQAERQGVGVGRRCQQFSSVCC